MIRTLLLDDEPLILRTMQAAIERCNPGYRIVGTAADGRTGLELVERLHPDVVFTDIRMPVMDGLGFVEAMRQRGIHTLVVIVSGYSDFEYAQKAIEYGVTAYLLKPVDTGKLLEAVEKAKQELHKQNLLEDYQTSCREFINNELISGEKERQFGPIVSQMLDYIHEHYAEKITLGIIAKNLHYSENFILRRFKDEVKANFSEYLSLYRISQAMEMMRSTEHTLSEIALLCGFSEYKYFRVVFTRYVGCTPKDFQRLVKEDRFFAKKQ